MGWQDCPVKPLWHASALRGRFIAQAIFADPQENFAVSSVFVQEPRTDFGTDPKSGLYTVVSARSEGRSKQ